MTDEAVGGEDGAASRLGAQARARRHSARVRWLRRTIPLVSGGAALAVLGLAWLDPFGRLAGAGITVGPIGVSGTKVSMQNPRLTGFRKETRPYEVTAAMAFQDVRKPAIVELQRLRGHVATDDSGGRAHLEAAGGVFDTTKEQLELRDEIRLWTENGQEVRLRSASVDLKAGTARSRDPVQVTFADGTLEAASLEVADNGRTLAFVGRVRAVFTGDPRGRAGEEMRPETTAGTPAGTPAPVATRGRVLTSSAEDPPEGRR